MQKRYDKYDIRTSKNACRTLVRLSGVDISTWEKYVGHEREYRYTDDLVEDVIKTYEQFPRNYRDFNFIYFHVTTSANKCIAIRKYGILDLKQAYRCEESEFRVFLDQHGVFIDLANGLLTCKGRTYDISCNSGTCPRTGGKNTYAGQVHYRPEILWDIDNLLRLNLSGEWEQSHFPYEITAQVKGSDIVFDGDEDQSDKDKVLMYLTMAYDTAFGEPFEHALLIKNRRSSAIWS